MSEETRQESPIPFELNPVLKARKMSKRRLAKLTGIPITMLCRLAKPGVNPTWATLMRLVSALDCDPKEFMGKVQHGKEKKRGRNGRSAP